MYARSRGRVQGSSPPSSAPRPPRRQSRGRHPSRKNLLAWRALLRAKSVDPVAGMWALLYGDPEKVRHWSQRRKPYMTRTDLRAAGRALALLILGLSPAYGADGPRGAPVAYAVDPAASHVFIKVGSSGR